MNENLRYKKPNRFDVAPYGTIYTMEESGKLFEWIQIEPQPDNGTAEWIDYGAFIHEVLRGCDLREDFVIECLRIYSGEIKLHESTLKHIIAERPKIEESENEIQDTSIKILN